LKTHSWNDIVSVTSNNETQIVCADPQRSESIRKHFCLYNYRNFYFNFKVNGVRSLTSAIEDHANSVMQQQEDLLKVYDRKARVLERKVGMKQFV
jgi:hypothetical protein